MPPREMVNFVDDQQAKPTSEAIEAAVRAFERHHGEVLIYENPEVMPRAYLVGRARVARGDSEALETLLSAGFDPWKEVVVTGQDVPRGERSETPGTATVRTYGRNEVVVDVQAKSSAYLVLSDTFFPGWNATVDNRPAEILQANVCQRAVAVDVGPHEVRFTFRPRSVIAGFFVTLAGIGASGFRVGR